jgi:hypothetical protein
VPVPHAVRQQEHPAAVGARGVDQRLQVGEEAAEMQSRLAGLGLIAPVGQVRERNADQLAQRWPAERDDGGACAGHSGVSQPLLIESSAGEGVLEAIVEAMNEYQQVASGVGQVALGGLAELALLDIPDLRDRADVVRGEIGIVHERGAVGDGVRVRRPDDAVAITR